MNPRLATGQLARWSPPHLRDIVDSLWHFKGSLTYPRERIFPDGRVELIVHLGAIYRAVDGRNEPFARTCISGLLLRSAVIEAPPGDVIMEEVERREAERNKAG